MEKIIEIREYPDNGYDGFIVITDKQEIELSIENGQDCCERWGYFMSEDNISDYIGANLIDIELTDTALNEVKMKEEELGSFANGSRHEGGIMFVDLKTDRGVLQFVAYNEHNGYYGHEAKVVSTFLNYDENL